jgi:hypothetical protein
MANFVINKERDEELKLAQDIWQVYVDYADADWHTKHNKKLELVGNRQYTQGCPLCDNYFHSKFDCSKQCPLYYNGKTCYNNGSLCRMWKYADTKEEAKKIANFVVGRCRIARVLRQKDPESDVDSAGFKSNNKYAPLSFLQMHESQLFEEIYEKANGEENDAKMMPTVDNEPEWW